MATLHLTRRTRVLIVGLALSGVTLVGLPTSVHCIAPASATAGAWSFEEPAPSPSPGPAPNADGPTDPGQLPPEPLPHRRHIDGDPNIER
jgi:hypothetical protein